MLTNEMFITDAQVNVHQRFLLSKAAHRLSRMGTYDRVRIIQQQEINSKRHTLAVRYRMSNIFVQITQMGLDLKVKLLSMNERLERSCLTWCHCFQIKGSRTNVPSRANSAVFGAAAK